MSGEQTKHVSSSTVITYFNALVNRLFKILPMRENADPSIEAYLDSLQNELLGFQQLVGGVGNTVQFVTILSVLEYLKNNPDCEIRIVKREVFHAINLCDKLKHMCDGGDAP